MTTITSDENVIKFAVTCLNSTVVLLIGSVLQQIKMSSNQYRSCIIEKDGLGRI